MTRYLNPKSDLVFKKIFEEHPHLLKSFLNTFLPLPPDRLIERVDPLPTENIPEIPGFKYSVVDVRCIDTQGRHFIVEMQIRWTDHFMQRMLFNSASAYVRQLQKGETYDKLCPVYGLSIVDAKFSEDHQGWFHHYQMKNVQDPTKTLDDIQLVFLELPKFKPTTMGEKKLTVLWLRFLTEINEKTQTVDPSLFESPEISEALKYTEIAAYTSDELRVYDANWDAISTEKTLLLDTYQEGKMEGLEQGREEIAHTLLSNGLTAEFVSKNTNIDLDIVKKIQTALLIAK